MSPTENGDPSLCASSLVFAAAVVDAEVVAGGEADVELRAHGAGGKGALRRGELAVLPAPAQREAVVALPGRLGQGEAIDLQFYDGTTLDRIDGFVVLYQAL